MLVGPSLTGVLVGDVDGKGSGGVEVEHAVRQIAQKKTMRKGVEVLNFSSIFEHHSLCCNHFHPSG